MVALRSSSRQGVFFVLVAAAVLLCLSSTQVAASSGRSDSDALPTEEKIADIDATTTTSELTRQTDSEGGHEDQHQERPRLRIPPRKRFVIDEIVSNHSLVRAELLKRGWVEPSRAVKKRSWDGPASAQFLWTWSLARTKVAPADQIVNHFPHFEEIGTKIGLWKNLYHAQDRAVAAADVHGFFPRCYLLVRDPEAERKSEVVVDPLAAERDKRRFVADFMRGVDGSDGGEETCDEFKPWPQQASIEGTRNIWIVKPSRAARGVDIQLFSNLTALLEYTLGAEAAAKLLAAPFAPIDAESPLADRSQATNVTDSIPLPALNLELTEYATATVNHDASDADAIVESSPSPGAAATDDATSSTSSPPPSSSSPSFIVQKYIERPLLVSGLKFDMRQFVLVTSLDPLVVFISDDYYLRFTASPFTLDNIDDRFLHLTNHQVQKNAPDFHDAEIKDNQWSSRTFIQHLSTTYGEGTWEKRIKPRIDELIVTTMLSWPTSGHRENSFEMLGLDIMLDEDLQPWLLEVNVNPGLHLLTDVVSEHHPKFVADMFKVVLDERASWEALPEFHPTFTADEEAPLVIGSLRLAYKGPTSATKSSSRARARTGKRRARVTDWDML